MTTWYDETVVIVAGSGGGLVGAYTAAREGLSVMVAEAKGFFTEEGISHRIMDGGPGKNPVPIVGAGQATFGITAGGNNVFQARLAKDPVDVVAVGTLLQRGPYSYITLAAPGDPDPKPKDLEVHRDFMHDFLESVRQAKKAGLTASAAAKAWRVPARYVGYTADRALVGGGFEWIYRRLP